MKVQLAKTTGWYREGGQSTWGFGVEVHNFADPVYDEQTDSETLEPDGWQVSIMLGVWAVFIYSEAGFEAVHGLLSGYGTFSVVRA